MIKPINKWLVKCDKCEHEITCEAPQYELGKVLRFKGWSDEDDENIIEEYEK